MANSLEVRSPFLDHKVMEFAARLPAHYKLQGRQLKYLLRRLGRRLIPAGAMNRRKMGFGVPLARWFRSELKPMLHDVVLSDRALQRGYFKPDYLRGLVQDHSNSKTDHSFQLWALLWLELWHREFHDAQSVLNPGVDRPVPAIHGVTEQITSSRRTAESQRAAKCTE